MFIVKVPGVNGLGKTKGTRNAGNEILNEISRLRDTKILDIEEIHVDNNNLEEQEKLIYENAEEIFQEKSKTFFLGGDHSISFSLVRAFYNNFRDVLLIVFDAHADCMTSQGHAEFPTHEEWLRSLVERGFPRENIILIGLRKIEAEERLFLEKNKIKYYESDKLEDIEIMCDALMENARKYSKVYLSLDIDVIDPAFAPSTNYLEPGGFTSKEMIYIVKRLSRLKNLNAVDLVEVDSIKDKKRDNITIKLAAKILDEFLKS